MSQVKISRLIMAMLSATIAIGTFPHLTIAQPFQQISLHQNFARLYLIGGKKQWKDGNYQEALDLLNKAIEATPDSAEAHFWRGMSYDSLKNFDMAIADFDRTIVIDKDYGLAYYMRGLNYSTQKNYSKAIADLEVAARLLRASGDTAYADRAEQTVKMLKVLNK